MNYSLKISYIVLIFCINSLNSCRLIPVPLPPSDTNLNMTATPVIVESLSSDVSTPITVKLILSKVPVLGEPVELVMVIKTIRDACETTAKITLPANAKLINGDLYWRGDLEIDRPITLRSTIAFEKEGTGKIEGWAHCPLNNGDSWGDLVIIYLYVSQDKSYIGFPTVTPSSSIQEDLPTPPPVTPIP